MDYCPIKKQFIIGESAIKEMRDQGKGKFSCEFAQYPLHTVNIFHGKLDIYVVDKKDGRKITNGRPWVSLAIDEYSKVIWAMDVSLLPPSTNTVRRLLQNGIFPKHIKEKYNTTNEWEVNGIPKTIRLDRRLELHCYEINDLIVTSINAKIERLPEMINRNSTLITNIFNNIHSLFMNSYKTKQIKEQNLGKPCYQNKNEIFALQDIVELLAVYITDVYHFQTNKSLPPDSNIPMVRYKEKLELINTMNAEKENYHRIELLATGLVVYTNKGAVFRNILYSSNEFWELLGRKQTKCKIKYDYDTSRLYILAPNANTYVKLSAIRLYKKTDIHIGSFQKHLIVPEYGRND